MTKFQPNLIEEPINHLEYLTPGVKYEAGSMFGRARVVSNDGDSIKFCYQYSEKNCSNCVVDCPFRKSPNRKES